MWAYEGDCTLADLIQKRDFPTAAEPLLFGRPLNIPPGPERKAAVIRLILQQLLECLAACHAVGESSRRWARCAAGDMLCWRRAAWHAGSALQPVVASPAPSGPDICSVSEL